MMSFYDRKGVESWSQGIVPHFITCNAFIGRAYAKVLLGFLRDCKQPNAKLPLDSSEPLYIVELGAGSGKFSFFMLKAINELSGLLNFPCTKLVYVMTDFTWNNLKFWNEHESLRLYIDNGQLDVAIFDAVNDESIKLYHSDLLICPSTMRNPICVIANYLFDTLCHDIFQVENGELKEGLISVGSRKDLEDDPLDPEIIKRFDNQFQYRVVDEDYYTKLEVEDARHFKRILRWYRDFFGNSQSGASILLPIGALRALRRLTSFAGGRALVLSGDKGNNNHEQFRGLMDPHVAVHGSFSVMVNYHAIGLYCTSRSGFVLHDPQEEASLKVSALVFTGESSTCSPLSDSADRTYAKCVETRASSSSFDLCETQAWTGNEVERLSAARSIAFPYLCRTFRDSIISFGPNDFFVMQKSMKEDTQRPALKAIVALLKLSNWDPDVFYKFRDVILQQVPTCTIKLRSDLCRNLPYIWANHFILDKDKDVAFEVGRLYYGLRMYEDAVRFYCISVASSGEHHVTFHNMGLCYYSLGQLEVAMENFNKALWLKNDYAKARAWQQKLIRETKG